MKEQRFHHKENPRFWEEERSETALDYHPIKSYVDKIRSFIANLFRSKPVVTPKGWRLIDQILDKKINPP